jgi:hypothetical protein
VLSCRMMSQGGSDYAKSESAYGSLRKPPGDLGANRGRARRGQRKYSGVLLTTFGTKAHVKLIVDDVKKAKEALQDAGLLYSEQVVLHAKLANVPGALGRFAATLAARKINITSGYQTIEKESKKASVVLEVSHLDKALRIYRSTASDRLYE